ISDGRIINNKNDFLHDIKERKEEFNIQNRITVDDIGTIEITSSKFFLTGNTSKDSALNLLNSRLSFKNNCHTIEIKNITITGKLEFLSNKNVIFDHVIYNGVFLANNDHTDLISTLQIYNSEFHLSEQNYGFVIQNKDMDIDNATFYGNTQYNIYLMKFSGQKDTTYNNTLHINDSLFSGNYHNGGIEGYYANITCTNTRFENFYSGNELNG
ncbi:hypothetical protein PIROE2DRAFT_17757, partial [Piromyces sp. E2]